MLFFAGIILGCTLALGYYYIFNSDISATLLVIVIYCFIFGAYVVLTNSIRDTSKIEILKDKIAFIFEKKGKVSIRQEIPYSDIKEYKITPGTDKKNLALETPKKDKFSLRVFGFRTTVETKDGNKLEFKDSNLDGVLIYSPGYIYRMIDLKRFKPDFPLVLENFDSKKDSENFAYQFEYYKDNMKVLPLLKNKSCVKTLIIYTLAFILTAFVIASVIGYFLYKDFADLTKTLFFVWITLGIVVVVVAPTYLTSFLTPVIGGIVNKKAGNKIKEVLD